MSALDRVLHLLETYKGRDRFLRFLTYSSKCAAGIIKSPQTASQFDTFSRQLSTSRAGFRLLDDVPTIAGVLSSKTDKEGVSTVDKIVSTLENFVDVIFSPLDHLSWAVEHKIIISKSTLWDTASVWCWVISLYINLYKLFKTLSKLARGKAEMTWQTKERESKKKLSAQVWYLEMSVLKCAADLLLAVNYLPKGVLWAQFFNKWQVGALGTFSSLIALYQALML